MIRKVSGWVRCGPTLISLDDISSLPISHGTGPDTEEWQLIIMGPTGNPGDPKLVASAIYTDEAMCKEDAEAIGRARRNPMFGGTVRLRGRA